MVTTKQGAAVPASYGYPAIPGVRVPADMHQLGEGELAELQRLELERMRAAAREAFARERREMWKAIVISGSIAIALKGEDVGPELKASAMRAIGWFDEVFAHEFLVEDQELDASVDAAFAPKPARVA